MLLVYLLHYSVIASEGHHQLGNLNKIAHLHHIYLHFTLVGFSVMEDGDQFGVKMTNIQFQIF